MYSASDNTLRPKDLGDSSATHTVTSVIETCSQIENALKALLAFIAATSTRRTVHKSGH